MGDSAPTPRKTSRFARGTRASLQRGSGRPAAALVVVDAPDGRIDITCWQRGSVRILLSQTLRFLTKWPQMRGTNERMPRRSGNYVAGRLDVSNEAGGAISSKNVWGEKDSNLRRHSRQIYSLIHLTALVSPLNNHTKNERKLSWRSGSNRRPADYKSAALPAELLQQIQLLKASGKNSMISLAKRPSSPFTLTAKSPALP